MEKGTLHPRKNNLLNPLLLSPANPTPLHPVRRAHAPPPTGWPISTETTEEKGTGIKATELRNRGKIRDRN